MTRKPDHGLRPGTRLELLSVGIPESEHTFDALAAKFPAEFKIRDSNFTLETLAKVLVHLTKSGIIKLPRRTSPDGR